MYVNISIYHLFMDSYPKILQNANLFSCLLTRPTTILLIKAFLRWNWQDKSMGAKDQACHNITPAKAAGYFNASGYIV
jgi:hypothetical protein